MLIRGLIDGKMTADCSLLLFQTAILSCLPFDE